MALLCPQCGAVLSEGAASCSRCNTSMVAGPTRPNTRWVRVDVQFRCRLCGLTSSLVPLHASEVVHCERCDRDQAFDPSVWPQVMDKAREALGAEGVVKSEVVIADDLPRKVGVALDVSSILDDPPQRPEGARQYIPSSDTYRGGARVGWFLLGKEADQDGIAPSATEDKEEAARDKRGFVRNAVVLAIECAALIATVVVWKGPGALSTEFWVPFAIGLLLNGIWGWACFSLVQRPTETDRWIYYVMALLPQAVWMGVTLLLPS